MQQHNVIGNTPFGDRFKGEISDVFVFDSPLTQAQLADLMNGVGLPQGAEPAVAELRSWCPSRLRHRRLHCHHRRRRHHLSRHRLPRHHRRRHRRRRRRPPPSSPEPPAPPVPALLRLVHGSEYCHLDNVGRCVSNPYPWTGNTTNGTNERCTIEALTEVSISAVHFATEEDCDFIKIRTVSGGVSDYSNDVGPQSVVLAEGDTFTWESDSSIARSGFVICAGLLVPPPTPPPSSPPFPPTPPLPPPTPPSPPMPPASPPGCFDYPDAFFWLADRTNPIGPSVCDYKQIDPCPTQCADTLQTFTFAFSIQTKDLCTYKLIFWKITLTQAFGKEWPMPRGFDELTNTVADLCGKTCADAGELGIYCNAHHRLCLLCRHLRRHVRRSHRRSALCPLSASCRLYLPLEVPMVLLSLSFRPASILSTKHFPSSGCHAACCDAGQVILDGTGSTTHSGGSS